jgi:hypothetical protein
LDDVLRQLTASELPAPAVSPPAEASNAAPLWQLAQRGRAARAAPLDVSETPFLVPRFSRPGALIAIGWIISAVFPLLYRLGARSFFNARWETLFHVGTVATIGGVVAIMVGWIQLGASTGLAGRTRAVVKLAVVLGGFIVLLDSLALAGGHFPFARAQFWVYLAFRAASLAAIYLWTTKRSVAILVIVAAMVIGLQVVIRVTDFTGLAGIPLSLLASMLAAAAAWMMREVTVPRQPLLVVPSETPSGARAMVASSHASGTAGAVELRSYRELLPFALSIIVVNVLATGLSWKDTGWVKNLIYLDSLCMAIWASIACKNCRALGAARTRFTSGFAFVTMIVPIANLLTARYTFQELWQRAHGATVAPPSRLIETTFRLLRGGGLAMLVLLPLTRAALRSYSSGGPVSSGVVIVLGLLLIIAVIAFVVGLVMRLIAVFQISRRQADAFFRLSVIHDAGKR